MENVSERVREAVKAHEELVLRQGQYRNMNSKTTEFCTRTLPGPTS